MDFCLGIDIGGTKTAIGVVDRTGNVHQITTIPTNLDISPEEMILAISMEVEKLLHHSLISENQLTGVGVGAPGPLDSKKGIVTSPPNLPNWRNVRLVDLLKRELDLPVFLENDANAATLGEKWVGAAQDCRDFVYLTISTGIGAGIYTNHELVTGMSGNAGDIGHVVLDPSYGTCVCGQKGCLEWIASGTAIARLGSEKLGEELTTKEVFELYKAKHHVITPLVEEIFVKIGAGCVTIINFLDPERIVIGGGVSMVGEPLFEAIQAYVRTYALNPSGRQTEIVPAGLTQNSGVIGAAALVFKGNETIKTEKEMYRKKRNSVL
jgi:glucokinase